MRKQFSGISRSAIDHDAPAKQTLLDLEQHFVQSYSAMKPRDGSNWQNIVFDQAIVRVLTTIKNSLYLARRGYVYETALVARGALEQIAWARGAKRSISENDLINLRVQRELGKLKSVYPSVGKLYGTLSKYSHFAADTHNLFYAKNNGELAVRMADRGTKFISMNWPFILSDICLVVFEEVYLQNIPILRGMTRSGKLRKSRFPMKYYKAYYEGLSDIDLSSLFS